MRDRARRGHPRSSVRGTDFEKRPAWSDGVGLPLVFPRGHGHEKECRHVRRRQEPLAGRLVPSHDVHVLGASRDVLSSANGGSEDTSAVPGSRPGGRGTGT